MKISIHQDLTPIPLSSYTLKSLNRKLRPYDLKLEPRLLSSKSSLYGVRFRTTSESNSVSDFIKRDSTARSHDNDYLTQTSSRVHPHNHSKAARTSNGHNTIENHFSKPVSKIKCYEYHINSRSGTMSHAEIRDALDMAADEEKAERRAQERENKVGETVNEHKDGGIEYEDDGDGVDDYGSDSEMDESE